MLAHIDTGHASMLAHSHAGRALMLARMTLAKPQLPLSSKACVEDAVREGSAITIILLQPSVHWADIVGNNKDSPIVVTEIIKETKWSLWSLWPLRSLGKQSGRCGHCERRGHHHRLKMRLSRATKAQQTAIETQKAALFRSTVNARSKKYAHPSNASQAAVILLLIVCQLLDRTHVSYRKPEVPKVTHSIVNSAMNSAAKRYTSRAALQIQLLIGVTCEQCKKTFVNWWMRVPNKW
eukprot:1149234-Pelagomonas_calceolata.AAC.10